MNNKFEYQLNSFNKTERLYAFDQLLQNSKSTIPSTENVNLHFHSFFSYHCEGWSPLKIAIESSRRGLYATGIIDFDVIDGMEEFYYATDRLGLRASVGIETRAFLSEFATKEIDSPGEPGVSYIAGAGFAKQIPFDSEQQKTLQYFSKKADERNENLIQRINPYVPDIAIDYKNDVLPLTPSGNATERHIVSAYVNKSIEKFTGEQLNSFWEDTLNISDQIETIIKDRTKLEDLVRSKFAKKGGFGYVQPDENTFPKVEDFFSWVKSCEAIPMESWLDGTSEGESDPRLLLEISQSKGAMALNIIPDRNWNIKDAQNKALKMKNLEAIVSEANSRNMPLHIGTEMNKMGLPFVDDLSGDELKPFKNSFLRGAQIITGHVILSRFADFAYSGTKATDYFGGNTGNKNDFFGKVGSLEPVNARIADILLNAGSQKCFDLINDSVKNSKWKI